MEMRDRRNAILDGIRKALHVKKHGIIEDDDLELVYKWSQNVCAMGFYPIALLPECPQDNPEKWSHGYKCMDCWVGLLLDGKPKKQLTEVVKW